MNEKSVFAEAIARSGDERSAYLDQVCGDDAQLRSRIDALLAAHDKPEAFQNDPVAGVDATVDHTPILERAGATIGPYTLREQVGEGGMGVVFVAEQQRPVRRKVALKIIRPGMDTREVVARFAAERQALALMDHPNIAKVYDAGSTESGRPYFVMELVRGIPITDYCDKNRLTIRERLALFIDVCQAIQHAHQKGIIHRDVKPSNVLVTLHDGKPVPKIIDFGVAKATNQRLTERTIYTRCAQIIGTPLYMSPEQAELSGLDVDTRSDIYSLGVLLYELLTGTTPFDKERIEKAAYSEIRRIICEEEPPKPSTKISTLGESATGISICRGTDRHSLSKRIMGDLDVIVMKAIEKDRTRRYGTATGLADDVQRFLEDQPIVARAPSVVYRFRKFTRRNRVAMATSAAVLVSLVVGLAGLAWGLNEARRRAIELADRNTQLTELAESYRSELVERALTESMRASPEAEALISRAETAGVERWKLEMLRGQLSLYSGRPEIAVRHLQNATRMARESGTVCVGAESMLTIAFLHAGRLRDQVVQSCEVDSLPLSEPVNPYDCLFKAQGYIAFPRRGLEVLDQAYPTGHAQTSLSLAVRAELLAWSGVTCQDLEHSRQALEYAHSARLLLGNTPFALQVDLLAHASVIAVARRQGQDWESYHAEACSIATMLRDAYSEYAWGGEVRSFHCLAAGDLAGADKALLDAWRVSNSPFYRTSLVMVRYQSNAADMVATAHAALRTMDSNWDKAIIAWCLTDTPEGRDQARAIHAEILASAKTDPQSLSGLSRLSLALGEPERAKEEARRALRESGIKSGPRSTYLTWTPEIDRFIADEIDASEFLRVAGPHRNVQSEAHLVIATEQFANREFEAALSHLDMAVELGFPWLWSQQFADGLRKRLQDPGRFDWLQNTEPED